MTFETTPSKGKTKTVFGAVIQIPTYETTLFGDKEIISY